MLNKITHRLLLGFLIPIPFLIVLGAILYTSIAHLVKLQENSRQLSNAVKNIDEFSYHTSRSLSLTRGYALYKEPYFRNMIKLEMRLFNIRKIWQTLMISKLV
jgi:methyl-accepting chemotaxis protein WspA